MPFSLELPEQLRKQGWKVKIRERERAEEPHVNIIRRTHTWRLGLRSLEFLDRTPSPKGVPCELLDHITAHADRLRAEWDRVHPHNPVAETEDDDA